MSQPQHTHHEHVESGQEPSNNSWTGYAAVKYGFIFLIVIALLYFTAAYLIPALTD